MKIKISKSQWEEIGRKADWLKKEADGNNEATKKCIADRPNNSDFVIWIEKNDNHLDAINTVQNDYREIVGGNTGNTINEARKWSVYPKRTINQDGKEIIVIVPEYQIEDASVRSDIINKFVSKGYNLVRSSKEAYSIIGSTNK